MDSTDQQQKPSTGVLLLALFSGVFVCVAIATVLIVLGVSVLEAYVFAALGGLTFASFIWIERSLIFQLRQKERQLGVEIALRQDTQSRLYARSLACFVRFDAGTLLIDRASPGFVKMLRLPVDTQLRGQRLEEVLGVNPLKLESVVDTIKAGDSAVEQPKIEITGADGQTTPALVSGQYFPQEHIVEAAFFIAPVNNTERTADLQAAKADMDRFRKGMFRRETRILELKEEVNALCLKAQLAPRYEIDHSSDDSKLRPLPSRTVYPREEKGQVS